MTGELRHSQASQQGELPVIHATVMTQGEGGHPAAFLRAGCQLTTEAPPSRPKDKLAIVCASMDHADKVARQYGITNAQRRNEDVMILVPGQAVVGHRFHTVLVTDWFNFHQKHAGESRRASLQEWIEVDLRIRVGTGKIIYL
jgi:hypothetical protein